MDLVLVVAIAAFTFLVIGLLIAYRRRKAADVPSTRKPIVLNAMYRKAETPVDPEYTGMYDQNPSTETVPITVHDSGGNVYAVPLETSSSHVPDGYSAPADLGKDASVSDSHYGFGQPNSYHVFNDTGAGDAPVSNGGVLEGYSTPGNLCAPIVVQSGENHYSIPLELEPAATPSNNYYTMPVANAEYYSEPVTESAGKAGDYYSQPAAESAGVQAEYSLASGPQAYAIPADLDAVGRPTYQLADDGKHENGKLA